MILFMSSRFGWDQDMLAGLAHMADLQPKNALCILKKEEHNLIYKFLVFSQRFHRVKFWAKDYRAERVRNHFLRYVLQCRQHMEK